MSTEQSDARRTPDYELEDRRIVTDRRSVTAMFHPIRGTVLDLLLERAATVKELAAALGRPASTIAYHTDILADADLIHVVRTRQVRSVTERFYGRTARTFVVGALDHATDGPGSNPLTDAATEAAPAHRSDDLRSIHRHARIPEDRAAEFWQRVLDLADDFMASARSGTETYALIAALYPAAYPSLPDRDCDEEIADAH